MARATDTLPLAIIVLLFGGVLLKPAPPSGSSRGQADESSRKPNAAAGESVRIPDAQASAVMERHTDAFDLLAAHLGIDVSDEALAIRAREAAGRLATTRGSRTFTKEQRAAFADLVGVPRDRLYGITRRRLGALLGNPLLQPDAVETRPDGTPVLDVTSAKRFLDQYLWLDHDQFRLNLVKEAIADAGLTVHALVATVPDPIDSNVRWMFDPMVDALQRAAADSDYVLDRFYVPDWKPNAAAEGTATLELATVHERWPGIVLFRHARRHELLVTFLVAETATFGIHQAALVRALAFKTMLDRDEPLRILGPSFSGSIDSLIHALNGFVASHPKASIRIVSGGVTAGNARTDIVRAVPQATFRTTVLPDQMVLEGVARHLYRIDPTLGSGRRIALLLESNTQYGRSVLPDHRVCSDARTPTATSAPTPTTAPSVDAEDSTADDSGRVQFSDWWKAFGASASPCDIDRIMGTALQVPFPMHISRLRAEAQPEARKPDPQPSVPSRFHALNLDEPGIATDHMPSFSPKLTSSSVELIVANILATLRRERITTVGLLATDTRDKLFLAQQIARAAPSMTMFTIESDLLFVHPDYNAYGRGLIIGSTYPLFAQNQSWTSRIGERRQRQLFSTTNSQGVYNATLALLDYDDRGRPIEGASVVPLADYRPPAPLGCFRAGCIPPVWISVVGRDDIWPIGFARPTSPDTATETPMPGQPYALAPEPASQVQPIVQGASRTRAAVHPSGPATLVLLLFALGCAVNAGVFWRWQTFGADRRKGPDLVGFDRGAPALAYQRVALTTLFVCGLFVAGVAYIAMRVTWWSGSIDLAVYVLVIVAVIAAGGAALKAWLSRDGRLTPTLPPAVRVLRVLLQGLAGVVAFAALVFLVQYAVTYKAAVAEPVTLTRYTVRSLQIGSGVSPLIPILLLALPIYLWAVLQLWRTGGPNLTPVIGATWIEPLIGSRDALWRAALYRLVASTSAGLPTWWLGAVAAGFAATVIFVAQLNIVTIEPYGYSWFLASCWLITQLFIAISLARSVFAWTLTSRLLRGLASTTLLDAFGRLPREAFAAHNRFSVRSPTRSDLVMPLRQRERLAAALASLMASGEAPVDPAVDALGERFQTALGARLQEIEKRPWSETNAFRLMMDDVPSVLAMLRLQSQYEDRAFLERKKSTETDDPVTQWMLRAEEYIVMLLVLVLREMLSRIVFGLLFVTVAVLLMAGALGSFPIHPWQPLMAFIWMWTLLAAVAGVSVAASIERNPIVSRLTGTPPNKLTWNAAFLSKVFVYAVVPILTLFAAQFPEIGDTLLRWFGPVQPLP